MREFQTDDQLLSSTSSTLQSHTTTLSQLLVSFFLSFLSFLVQWLPSSEDDPSFDLTSTTSRSSGLSSLSILSLPRVSLLMRLDTLLSVGRLAGESFWMSSSSSISMMRGCRFFFSCFWVDLMPSRACSCLMSPSDFLGTWWQVNSWMACSALIEISDSRSSSKPSSETFISFSSFMSLSSLSKFMEMRCEEFCFTFSQLLFSFTDYISASSAGLIPRNSSRMYWTSRQAIHTKTATTVTPMMAKSPQEMVVWQADDLVLASQMKRTISKTTMARWRVTLRQLVSWLREGRKQSVKMTMIRLNTISRISWIDTSGEISAQPTISLNSPRIGISIGNLESSSARNLNFLGTLASLRLYLTAWQVMEMSQTAQRIATMMAAARLVVEEEMVALAPVNWQTAKKNTQQAVQQKISCRKLQRRRDLKIAFTRSRKHLNRFTARIDNAQKIRQAPPKKARKKTKGWQLPRKVVSCWKEQQGPFGLGLGSAQSAGRKAKLRFLRTETTCMQRQGRGRAMTQTCMWMNWMRSSSTTIGQFDLIIISRITTISTQLTTFTCPDICFACACVCTDIVVTTGTVADAVTAVKPLPDVSVMLPGVKPTERVSQLREEELVKVILNCEGVVWVRTQSLLFTGPFCVLICAFLANYAGVRVTGRLKVTQQQRMQFTILVTTSQESAGRAQASGLLEHCLQALSLTQYLSGHWPTQLQLYQKLPLHLVQLDASFEHSAQMELQRWQVTRSSSIKVPGVQEETQAPLRQQGSVRLHCLEQEARLETQVQPEMHLEQLVPQQLLQPEGQAWHCLVVELVKYAAGQVFSHLPVP